MSVMPSNHLILCRPLFLPPSIFPSIRVFSNWQTTALAALPACYQNNNFQNPLGSSLFSFFFLEGVLGGCSPFISDRFLSRECSTPLITIFNQNHLHCFLCDFICHSLSYNLGWKGVDSFSQQLHNSISMYQEFSQGNEVKASKLER